MAGGGPRGGRRTRPSVCAAQRLRRTLVPGQAFRAARKIGEFGVDAAAHSYSPGLTPPELKEIGVGVVRHAVGAHARRVGEQNAA